MSIQNGSLVLIKIGDGATLENFTTLGGLMNCEISVQQPLLEKNTLESGAFRQALSSAGHRSIRISGEGLFTDSVAEAALRAQSLAGSAVNYEFVFASGAKFRGAFMVTRYERSGNYETPESYAVTLESAGAITYSAS